MEPHSTVIAIYLTTHIADSGTSSAQRRRLRSPSASPQYFIWPLSSSAPFPASPI
jgi:hypothetical protein